MHFKNTCLFIFCLFLLIGLTSCFHYRYSKKEITNFAIKNHIPSKMITYDTLGIEVTYYKFGYDSLPKILFLHGAPGSSKIFNRYALDTSLTNHCQLIFIDRPGYGRSQFGKALCSIDSQAMVLEKVLTNENNKIRFVGFGTSYGGPVISIMAARNPEKFNGLVLLSPALGPGMEKTPGINKAIKSKWLGWIFPVIARVASKEKYSHKSSLIKIEAEYAQVECPITLIHGRNDWLVYPKTVEYASNKFIRARMDTLTIPNQTHFLTWKFKPLIISKFFKYVPVNE